MLEWNDTAPYNAVHMVRIPGPLNVERLGQVINSIVEWRGLTTLVLDREKGMYRYQGGAVVCELPRLPERLADPPGLMAEIERQLNAAFVPGDGFRPFRFFLAPADSSFWLGLTYFHAIADAESVVLLMKEIVESYQGRNSEAPQGNSNLYPRCFDNLLRDNPRLMARKLSAIPGRVWDMATSSRPPNRGGSWTMSWFTLFSLEAEALSRMKATARNWGVTLNDLFMGLLMHSIGPVARERFTVRRRRRVAVGCIVNTRKDLGMTRGQDFGLFLGSFIVTHAMPENVSLRQLVADVNRQTRSIKQHKLYVGAPLEMGLARLVLSVLPAGSGKQLYHRYYPLWGGVTNMNLNALWSPADGEGPMDYIRAVSTSPATPLVLSATTVGNKINLAFTYRSSAYSQKEAEEVKTRFLEGVNQLEVPA